jgi:hypothetical protein
MRFAAHRVKNALFGMGVFFCFFKYAVQFFELFTHEYCAYLLFAPPQSNFKRKKTFFIDMNKRQIFKLNNREKNKIISVSLFVFLFRDFIFVFDLFGNLKNEWEKIDVKQ